MSKCSRLKLTPSYHKIAGKTPEEQDIEAQKWVDDNQPVCHICDSPQDYRDIREYDDDFKVRTKCSNHSKTVHFSFLFPKTKKAWETQKAEQDAIEAEKAADKKAKADAKAKKETSKKKKTSKKEKAKKEPEPLPEGIEEDTPAAYLYRSKCPECKEETVEITDTKTDEDGDEVSVYTCSKCDGSWEF